MNKDMNFTKQSSETEKIKLYSSSISAMRKVWEDYFRRGKLNFHEICERIVFVGGHDAIGMNIFADELLMLVTAGYPKKPGPLASFLSDLLCFFVANNNYNTEDVMAFLFGSSTAYRLSRIPAIGWGQFSASYIVRGMYQLHELLDGGYDEVFFDCIFSHD